MEAILDSTTGRSRPGEAVTDPVACTLAFAAAAAAPWRRASHRLSSRGRGAGHRGHQPSSAGGDSVAAGSSSTAPGLAQARWPASPATTPSRSTRARASSWSSTRRTARRWSGSCSPSPARAPRACLCSRPSTVWWSRAQRPSIRRTPTTGPSAPAPERDPAQGDRHLSAARRCRARRGIRGAAPAGRGVNYLIGRLGPLPGLVNVAAIRSTGLTASLAIAERVCADRRRARRGARSAAAARAGLAALRVGPCGAGPPSTGSGRQGGGMKLLLGIDEGTSAVKAVLFDADLRPVRRRGARRRSRIPARAGWSRTPRRCWPRSSTRSPRSSSAPRRSRRCGLDHQGESVLAWDAESGRPLTPIVTWQDKRSQEVLDRLEADGLADEVRERSGMPLDPYFSAGKLTWLLEHDEAVARAATPARCGWAPSTRSSATGWAPGSPPIPATASRTQLGAPEWDPALLEIFGVPARRCPRSPTPPATWAPCGTTRGRSSCRCGRAAPTSRRRSPGPAA